MYKNKENSIKIPIFVKTKSTIIKKIVHFRAITTTELINNYSFKNMGFDIDKFMIFLEPTTSMEKQEN